MLESAKVIAEKIIKKHHAFAFEWSEHSRLWNYRQAKELFAMFGDHLEECIINGCREGLKDSKGKRL